MTKPHIHTIYDLYLFLESHSETCEICKDFRDRVGGSVVDIVELHKERDI